MKRGRSYGFVLSRGIHRWSQVFNTINQLKNQIKRDKSGKNKYEIGKRDRFLEFMGDNYFKIGNIREKTQMRGGNDFV